MKAKSQLQRVHFNGGKMLRPMYYAMLMHVKESQVVEISAALHVIVSHNQIFVLGCRSPEINQHKSKTCLCKVQCVSGSLVNQGAEVGLHIQDMRTYCV